MALFYLLARQQSRQFWPDAFGIVQNTGGVRPPCDLMSYNDTTSPYLELAMNNSHTQSDSSNPPSQRAVDSLLDAYADSHRNHTNEIIHFICVPVIVFTVLGLFWTAHPLVAVAAAVLSLMYYCTLSIPFAIGMLLMASAMLGVLYVLPHAWVMPFSVTVFVLAWIGQFIGHKIEGKKPSFFDDLRFLLIGPLFVLSFLYRKLHIAF
jgi:uncharacterized membrane protein YGL010W